MFKFINVNNAVSLRSKRSKSINNILKVQDTLFDILLVYNSPNL